MTVSSVPLQQSLRKSTNRVQELFAGRAKYLPFKSKKHRQVAEFTYRVFTFKHGELKHGELKVEKCDKPLESKKNYR